MPTSTAMATSFKQELFSGGHCFNATVTPTVTATSGSTSVTSVSSMLGVAVGMTVTGTGIAANTVVARITSNTAMTLSVATTAAISAAAVTVAGDTFMIALIKVGHTGTYDASTTNYTALAPTTDEASGSNYTAGGQALVNVTATTGGTFAFVDFQDPSWSSATFSTTSCMIYNASVRNGGTSGTNASGGGRCVSTHDFGGAQQVSSGTFTILMPTPSSAAAILRLQ